MEKEILNTTAMDSNGNLIHINNAEKGTNYSCPVCKKDYILRKSGKIGRGSRRPHFAHYELSPNCTPEGVLHYSFKKMLIDILEKYISENRPFKVDWTCHSCGCKNSGNLLGKTIFIKEENALGEFRPDISLVGTDDKVLAVIELVDTHEPEENILQYYKANQITLIQINLTSEDDLYHVEEKAKNPDIVDLCYSSRCENRDRYKITRQIRQLLRQCGRCLSKIPKFVIEIDSIFGIQISYDFSENELDQVKSKYSYILIHKDPTTNNKYPIFDCVECKRINSRFNRRRF